MKICSFSKKGRTRPRNEDYVITKSLGDQKAYVIVCDGASSKPNSWLGAKEIATGISMFLESDSETGGTNMWKLCGYHREEKEILIKLIHKILTDTAIDYEISVDSLGCTMMLLLYDSGHIVTYHIGDGEITAFNMSEYNVISCPINGFSKEYSYLSTSEELGKHIRIDEYYDTGSDIIAVFTDGADEHFKNFLETRHKSSNETRSPDEIIKLMESETYEDDASLVLIET